MPLHPYAVKEEERRILIFVRSLRDVERLCTLTAGKMVVVKNRPTKTEILKNNNGINITKRFRSVEPRSAVFGSCSSTIITALIAPVSFGFAGRSYFVHHVYARSIARITRFIVQRVSYLLSVMTARCVITSHACFTINPHIST